MNILAVKIKNVEFNSPIIAASGTFGYGDECANFVDLDKIGCIITKSITLEPRKGNLQPRIHESKLGMINAIGLANVGVQNFCEVKLPKLNSLNTKIIISIAGSNQDDYINIIKMIEKYNGNHIGYEINISCPNVKEGGMEFGSNSEITYKLISKIRESTSKLVIVKLGPNVTCIEDIAQSAESAGADAISAINTFVGLAIDYKTGKIILKNKFGGVSGPGIKPLALAKVHKIYNKINIPVIGIGGISCFEDVIEFIRIGSSLVQVGTLNYRDPSIFTSFNENLSNFIKNNNMFSISQLIGNYEE
tara:strand:+ start:4229 stop:5143 length:915 start_codon:yes stop_codon:yes gene_type:complete